MTMRRKKKREENPISDPGVRGADLLPHDLGEGYSIEELMRMRESMAAQEAEEEVDDEAFLADMLTAEPPRAAPKGDVREDPKGFRPVLERGELPPQEGQTKRHGVGKVDDEGFESVHRGGGVEVSGRRGGPATQEPREERGPPDRMREVPDTGFDQMLQQVAALDPELHNRMLGAYSRATDDEVASTNAGGAEFYFRRDNRYTHPNVDPYIDVDAEIPLGAPMPDEVRPGGRGAPTSEAEHRRGAVVTLLQEMRKRYPREYERLVRGHHIQQGTADDVSRFYRGSTPMETLSREDS